MDSIIETGVDKLIELVKKKGRISFQDAATELEVSTTVLEEWADFLEEDGIISIEYKLTTPYIVERKLTKNECLSKAKEFVERKDTFISKAESMLNIIEKESKEFEQIRNQSTSLRKNIGMDIARVKNELASLERYEGLKEELHKKIIEKEQEFKQKLEDVTNQIFDEQKKYENLLKSVKDEATKIDKEKFTAKSIQEKEEMLLSKIREFENMAENLRNNIKDDYKDIINSEEHANKLKRFADGIKDDITKKKISLLKILSEREKKELKIMQLHEDISKKIEATAKNITSAKATSKKFREFFEKKMQINEMIDRLNKNRDYLKKELEEMIRKARLFHLSSKSEDVSKEVKELEEKFNAIDKKKTMFETELKKFMGIFR